MRRTHPACILKTVAERIDKKTQVWPYTVHPPDTNYVRKHQKDMEMVYITVRTRKRNGGKPHPKQKGGE